MHFNELQFITLKLTASALIKKEKIYLWQVAEVLVIHETTLINRFRTEMSDDHKNQVLTAIEVIKQQRNATKD